MGAGEGCFDLQSAVASCTASLSSNGNSAWTSVSASSSYGALSVSASGQAFGRGAHSIAQASAAFSDMVLIHGAGAGLFEYTVALTGMGAGNYASLGAVSLNGRGLRPGPSPQFETFIIPITFEVPFELALSLRLGNASWIGSFGDAGSVSARAAVSSVRIYDSDGRLLSGYSYRTDSLHDYGFDGLANPEPGTLILVGAGMILVARLRRKPAA